jgi:hypothetical protein
MSNWIELRLDVLASCPDEINRIERALQEPGDELIAWCAQRSGEDPQEIVADIKGIVSFKPIRNLGYVHPSVNKARRFQNSFKDRSWGVVWSHVDIISNDFPEALFLREHWNLQASSASRRVIRAGQEIRSVYDGSQRALGHEWVLPDIFAPYRSEYELGLECGSLWDQWLDEMQSELADLKAFCVGSKVAEQQNSVESRNRLIAAETNAPDIECAGEEMQKE